jgi:hypothetical protein
MTAVKKGAHNAPPIDIDNEHKPLHMLQEHYRFKAPKSL